MRKNIINNRYLYTTFSLFLIFYGIAGVSALTTQEIAKIALDSTVLIEMTTTDDATVSGSGFVIADGLIATNLHVIEGSAYGYVKLQGDDTGKWIDSIRAVNEKNDLAIIEVDNLNVTSLTLADSDTVQIGDDIYVAGNPLGLEGTFSEGIISAIRPNNGVNLLQMSAPISSGNSGGPVLNSDAEVIGISVATLGDGQNLNFAIPVNILKTLMTESVNFPEISVKYDFGTVNDANYTPTSVSMSPDGVNIASGTGVGNLVLFDAETGELQGIADLTSEEGEPVWDMQFSANGSLFAATGYDGTNAKLYIYDGKLEQTPNTLTFNSSYGELYSVCFSPDSRYLAGSFGESGRVFVRDLSRNTDNTQWFNSPSAGFVDALEFSSDSKSIGIGGNDGQIYVIEVASLWEQNYRGIQFEAGAVVFDISFSQDGKYLAANGNVLGQKSVIIWDLATEDILHIIEVDQDYNIYDITFSPDSQFLAYGGQDRRITLHQTDVTFTRMAQILALHSVFNLAWSPDASLISNGRVVWNITETVVPEETPQPDPEEMTTPTQPSATVVSFSPTPATSPYPGEQLPFALNITGAENVTGYEVILQYDNTALQFVDSENGDFLPADSFFNISQPAENQIALTATALSKQSSNGDGMLAILTFEVLKLKPSTLTITHILLSDLEGITTIPEIEVGEIIEPQRIKGDVNQDGVVNISDLILIASLFGQTDDLSADVNGDGMVNISDLVIAAGEILGTMTAPVLFSHYNHNGLTRTQVEQWLQQANLLNPTDVESQRGIRFLEQLLLGLTPKETTLLPNFPNPFNPETWIPYQLSKSSDVMIMIYNVRGIVVRQLKLGHQAAGMYQNRSRAAYWDGKNTVGDKVASGVYFYTLTAGDFTATRKMLIRK